MVVVLLLAVLSLAATQQLSAATEVPSITLSADSDSIYLGDTLVIEMEAVGIEDTVDISPLLKDADLLRESQGTRIAVIDQQVVEVKIRRMEFLPRQEGQLLMGPVQGDSIAESVSSNSVVVSVLPPVDEQWQPAATDLQMSLTLTDGISGKPVSTDDTPYQTYIGQRIIVDIELRHQYPIFDEELVLPDFAGFDVLPAYEQRRTIEDDKWRVISWRYHLFAQRSGQLLIGEMLWRGVAIRSRTQRAAFTKRIPTSTVQIKPATEGIQWWLPASALSLQDSWSTDVLKLSAGDEVIRTITLDARDVLASHLPEVLPLQSRALSSTLIDQKRTQQLVGEHIQASATYTFRMLAESPIPVFLDTVRVGWYDTSNSEPREAIIPARRINVGLPERDDLLAALALGDNWEDRLALEARSFAGRFAYWHVSLVVLGLIACVMAGWEIRRVLREKFFAREKHSASDIPHL